MPNEYYYGRQLSALMAVPPSIRAVPLTSSLAEQTGALDVRTASAGGQDAIEEARTRNRLQRSKREFKLAKKESKFATIGGVLGVGISGLNALQIRKEARQKAQEQTEALSREEKAAEQARADTEQFYQEILDSMKRSMPDFLKAFTISPTPTLTQ